MAQNPAPITETYIGIGRVSNGIAIPVADYFGFGTAVFNFSSQRFKGGEGNSFNFLNEQLGDHPSLPILNEDQRAQIANGIRDSHVILLQSISGDNADTRLVTLAQRVRHTKYVMGAASVTVIAPKMGYDRSDREFLNPSGNPEHNAVGVDTAALFLRAAGADRLITFDPHSAQAKSILLDHFDGEAWFPTALPLVAGFLRERFRNECGAGHIVFGAPDGADKPSDEGQARARLLRDLFCASAENNNDGTKADMFYIAKERTGYGNTRVTRFDGDVNGKTAIIVDDIADSGGTILNAARVLRARGAKQIVACVTHGTLVDDALKRILEATDDNGRKLIDHFVITDSIPGVREKIKTWGYENDPRLSCISQAPLVIEQIKASISRPPVSAAARADNL